MLLLNLTVFKNARSVEVDPLENFRFVILAQLKGTYENMLKIVQNICSDFFCRNFIGVMDTISDFNHCHRNSSKDKVGKNKDWKEVKIPRKKKSNSVMAY